MGNNDHIVSQEPGLWTTVVPSDQVPGGYVVSTGDLYNSQGQPIAGGPYHHASHVYNPDGTSANVPANNQWHPSPYQK